MKKKFKNIKDFLETCSEDEREYIYDLYNNADDTIKEIEEYREEIEWDDAEAERLNK
jgi:hypothetical protein